MGLRDVFHWWPQPASMTAHDDSLIADHTIEFFEPLESTPKVAALEFRRSDIKPQIARKYSSLLTKAINEPIIFAPEPEIEKNCHPPPQQPRKSIIKFACSAPPPQPIKVPGRSDTSNPPLTSSGLSSTRSSFGHLSILSNKMTEPTNKSYLTPSTSRSLSLSSSSGLSQATGFYEFASEEIEEENWLRQDLSLLTSKLTINDLLKKENDIRRLASEVEQEELDEVNDNQDDDNDDDDDSEVEEECDDFEYDSSDIGNETDNEAGFADSDESDVENETEFWTPGRRKCKTITRHLPRSDLPSIITSTHYRSGSNSSTDFPPSELNLFSYKRRRRKLKTMRTGTPDLPDSTDFVCGTLDEDRPLEEAYLSCLEARKQARHRSTPQDIDPSFPTSDTDDEEKQNEHDITNSAERHRRYHSGKSESKSGRLSRTLSRNRSSNSCHSPKKLHSPPPNKYRLRSPARKTTMCNKSPKICYTTTPSVVIG
ncbi:hypothetical protein OnM2_035067 [Erysiphe neolycopersici]|uniref:Uncharacterized protein n=1 Tax=Erysiphe neolycopersici TaxID=212602 RepID=A0A420HXE6_9PEZI|nr:hypothetical protein OnM2_035067 [Erysiphe neolycopersici]